MDLIFQNYYSFLCFFESFVLEELSLFGLLHSFLHFDLDYSTEITDDVVLCLTEDEVSDILDRVDTLPAVIIRE